MGFSRITQVITALQDAGIRADRGFPAAAMPEPSDPVAAVSVEKQTPEEMILAVVVYTTAAQGGILCENTADQVAQTLKAMEAVCTVGNCSFSGMTGLFSVRVLAAFWEKVPYNVKVDGQLLTHVLAVSAQKTVELTKATDAAGADVVPISQGWRLTLTEMLPARTVLTVETQKSFSIMVERPGGAEKYPDCYWEQITLEDTPQGLRRTRVAHTWSEKVMAVG